MPGIHKIFNEISRRTGGRMTHGPILTKSEKLILPSQEAHFLHNSWLNDFFPGKHSPGYCIWAITNGVGAQSRAFLNRIVGQVRITSKARQDLSQQVWMDEDFQVGFLIYVAIFGTPSIYSIGRLYSVYGRLRVNCQQSSFVKGDEVIFDDICF